MACASTCSPPGLRLRSRFDPVVDLDLCRINRPSDHRRRITHSVKDSRSANPRSPVRFSLVHSCHHAPMPMQRLHGFDAHSLAGFAFIRSWRVTRIWTASFVNRTPLLRFRPLQRSLAALRCPWLPCLRTIPLRRFATCRRPARPRKIADNASPLRFYAPRIRCGRARVRTFRRLRYRESQHASVIRSAQDNSHTMRRSQRPFTRASPANPNLSRSRTIRHVKQHRFTNPPPHAGSCTDAFLGAVFRYLGAKPSRPGRTMGPSLLAPSFNGASSPGGALGVLFFAGPSATGLRP